MNKIRYSVSGRNVFIRIAVTLMILSVLFRLMGYWGFWKNQTACFNYMQLLLPALSCIIYAVMLLKIGEKHFAFTLIPVYMGVVFFVVKAVDMKLFPMILCIAVSVLFGVVYTLTVFGGLPSKWALIGITAVPLLYQLIVRDGATLLAKENSMTMAEFIPELSILCILTALLLTAIAMKKYTPEDPDAIMGDVEGENTPETAEVSTLPESIAETPQEETEK